MAGKKTSESSSSISRKGKPGPLGSGKIKIALVDPDNNGLTNTSVFAMQNGSLIRVSKKGWEFEVDWSPTSAPVVLSVFETSPAGHSARKDAGRSKSTKKASSNPTTSKPIPKKLTKSTTRKVK